MRVAAGACARAGGSAHHRADSSARTAIDAIVALTRPIIPLSFWLERCAHRELDITDFFLARGGRVETVVDPDGTEGRVPAETGSHRVLELREIDGRAEALVRSVNVAHVEEEGGANAERQRHGVFEVAEDLEGPPDLGARGVFRRDLAGLEAADGIRPAEEVALEERHGILRPSEHVPRQETPAQDVIEPQRLVLGDGGGDTKEAVVTGADAREVGAEEGEGASGRLLRIVARVASERASEHRHNGLSLGGQELRAGVRIDPRDVFLTEPVHRVPSRVVADGRAEADVAARGGLRIILVDPAVAEDVEARGEGAIQKPGVRDADGSLLQRCAAPEPDGDLEAAAEEVVLGKVHRTQGAILEAVTAAHRKDARGLLRHLDVDDDLVFG